MFRVHQFNKVELFVFCEPETSGDEHDRLLAIEEEIVGALGLPYRVVNVAAGDLGAPAVKKYDIEAWFPHQQRYREVHLDLEHDRLPGPPARDPLPAGGPEGHGGRPHAERHRGHRPLRARGARELPRRGAGRAARRSARRDHHAVNRGPDCWLLASSRRVSGSNESLGGVPERSNGSVLKTDERLQRPPWVRIPAPPPPSPPSGVRVRLASLFSPWEARDVCSCNGRRRDLRPRLRQVVVAVPRHRHGSGSILSMVIFRFDITSVKSIGDHGRHHLPVRRGVRVRDRRRRQGGWWKALNAILGVLLAAGGIARSSTRRMRSSRSRRSPASCSCSSGSWI